MNVCSNKKQQTCSSSCNIYFRHPLIISIAHCVYLRSGCQSDLCIILALNRVECLVCVRAPTRLRARVCVQCACFTMCAATLPSDDLLQPFRHIYASSDVILTRLQSNSLQLLQELLEISIRGLVKSPNRLPIGLPTRSMESRSGLIDRCGRISMLLSSRKSLGLLLWLGVVLRTEGQTFLLICCCIGMDVRTRLYFRAVLSRRRNFKLCVNSKFL